MKLFAFVSIGLAALAIDAGPAEACSAPRCWAGHFTPADGVMVPANLPAIHWQPLSTFDNAMSDPAKVTLKTAGGASIALAATLQPDGAYLLVPETPLVAGETYTLVDANACGDTGETGPQSTFTTGPAAPLPTSLGSLAATSKVDTLEVATGSGSCSTTVGAAQAAIAIAFATDASPWKDALHYETRVDGERWSAQRSINVATAPGTSWRGRGTDLVYRVCQTTDQGVGEGLDEGTHAVQMRATLPGTQTMLATSDITVDLECDQAVDTCELEPTHPDCTNPPGPDGDGDGGCSTSSSSSAFAMLGFAGLLATRRGRKQR